MLENKYRRRRLEQDKNIIYNSEYDRVVGELSQTNVPYGVRHIIEERMQIIKNYYSESQLTKHKLLP